MPTGRAKGGEWGRMLAMGIVFGLRFEAIEVFRDVNVIEDG